MNKKDEDKVREIIRQELQQRAYYDRRMRQINCSHDMKRYESALSNFKCTKCDYFTM